ncbi:restriction endonuclease [Priestia endophytica]|uniref:restriction endonuclease n=1 Tax=Priestia endophytica TaxID=135735 RepID=UPI00228627CC|nr:restriction endonuclease [Priestia endophytica]
MQAKRYGSKNRVSLSAVQEIYEVQAYYKADEAWVIKNSFFTKSASALAEACSVQLFDRKALQELILEVNPTDTAKEVYQEVEAEPHKCPTCGKSLVVCQGKPNRFFECSSFFINSSTLFQRHILSLTKLDTDGLINLLQKSCNK